MKLFKSAISLLILLNIVVWISIFTAPDDKLHLIACGVGQGDAILITYKDMQILTDGGPDTSVINCLSKYMPFWDRTIEVVILTNPDRDHYQGLIEVFKRYKIDNYIQSPLTDSTQGYKVLDRVVGSSGARQYRPNSGTSIRYGLMSLDILYPNDGIKNTFKSPQNNNSTVTFLNFGEFEALFTGDIEEEASDYLSENFDLEVVDYIKVAHHGSRNGITKMLLEEVRPKVAVISAGKKNSYGHPHKEILEMLNQLQIKILGTYENGDIQLMTDGKSYQIIP